MRIPLKELYECLGIPYEEPKEAEEKANPDSTVGKIRGENPIRQILERQKRRKNEKISQIVRMIQDHSVNLQK